MADEVPTGLGTFCWTELMTRDVAAAKKFYGELIGWKTVDEKMGDMNYTMLFPPGAQQPVGGMMAMEGPQFEGVPPHWMPYIMVESVDETTQRCTTLGGAVMLPPTDIPNIGRFSVIRDPTGAMISLFQGA